MPNQKTWASEEERLRLFAAQEEALRMIGWRLVDGLWLSPHEPDHPPYTFEKACGMEMI